MKVLENELMSRHTSFRVGGPAKCYVIPESCHELEALIGFLGREQLPYLVIGNGSNLLVSDAGVDCVVVEVGSAMAEAETEGTRLVASAGTLLGQAAALAAANSLSGMEELRGIPGSVGGACVMNAGAYGREIADILEWVDIVRPDGTLSRLRAEELELGYRHSAIPALGCTVVRAGFLLKREPDEEAIRARMAEYARRRREKQPLDKPSAGSTFKRPEGHFAGKLIEDAGLQGFALGGAAVSEKHCGFVVNNGGASAAEIYALIREVQRRVHEASGIWLEPEVKLIGDFA